MMSDKAKRKNSETLLTYYDRGWSYTLYRWARVSKSRHMHVPLSPERCLQRLKPVEETKDYHQETYIRKTEVVPLENGSGYEFQAQIRKGWRGYDQPNVNGVIVDDGNGQSIVTLRTYPPFLYIGGIIALFFCCYGSWNSPERIAVCGFLFMILIACLGIMADQDFSLNHVISHLTKPQPLVSHNPDGLPFKKPRHPKNIQRKF